MSPVARVASEALTHIAPLSCLGLQRFAPKFALLRIHSRLRRKWRPCNARRLLRGRPRLPSTLARLLCTSVEADRKRDGTFVVNDRRVETLSNSAYRLPKIVVRGREAGIDRQPPLVAADIACGTTARVIGSRRRVCVAIRQPDSIAAPSHYCNR